MFYEPPDDVNISILRRSRHFVKALKRERVLFIPPLDHVEVSVSRCFHRSHSDNALGCEMRRKPLDHLQVPTPCRPIDHLIE
jgi:hypothetical protein